MVGQLRCHNKNYALYFQSVVDYFKMDIEGSEVPSLKEMIPSGSLKNVKQLAFEVHMYDQTKLGRYNFYSLLYSLEKLGFRRYYYHINPNCFRRSRVSGIARSMCYELYYININYL